MGVIPGLRHSFSSLLSCCVTLLMTVATGLQYVDIGSPLATTAFRAKGFDLALVAVLDRPEDAPIYAEHAAHVKYVAPIRFLVLQ